MSKISVIITAGGTSTRYGNKNKLLEKINGKTVIEYSVEKFLPFAEIFEIVISANKTIKETVSALFSENKKIRIVNGGETRQASVFNALKTIKNADYVLIHDGARPLVDPKDITCLIDKMKQKNAVILAVKTVDTIKRADENGMITETINRSNLYNVQTPQGFKFSLIYDAHKKLEGQNYTDDAGMIETLGFPVYIEEGQYSNFKITTPDDTERMKIELNKT